MTKAERAELQAIDEQIRTAHTRLRALTGAAVSNPRRWNADRVSWERLTDYEAALGRVLAHITFTVGNI